MFFVYSSIYFHEVRRTGILIGWTVWSSMPAHIRHITYVTFFKHTHTQPFCSSLNFDWDNPGEPVPEETFTHSHLSWSSVIPYVLPLSITIHIILPVQFTCLTVFFHNLSPSFLCSTSWPGTIYFIRYTFLHPIIVVFSQHMPIPSQPVFLTFTLILSCFMCLISFILLTV